VHHILIKTQRKNGVLIRVEDDGPGIRESLRPRLFRKTTTSKQAGMGVALVVWRDAIRMYGGELECTSYALPTSFLITIPLGGDHATHSAG
jgi:nitrogen-specific signal transduction histidine kinase